MAIGFVVGYGEYGEYGDVTPTDYWEEDDNDCGHEYSCTNSKLHPYNNLCDITHKVVIHGVKAITHDVKAIAITHGVESIAHVLFEVSGNLNLAAASSIAVVVDLLSLVISLGFSIVYTRNNFLDDCYFSFKKKRLKKEL
ncbi:4944_t:CDS:2 [Entrophospora sp. SA101]|nr:18635_t:CDS:2 [Entrophospora sp. SA101]CAJ0863929.1 4944_t:CDS:2 [Entrophospora sp. SA101]